MIEVNLMKKTFFVVLILVFFLVSGCEDKKDSTKDIASDVEKCGDGICESLELKKGLCPNDCATESYESPDTQPEIQQSYVDLSQLDVSTPVEPGVVYITMMVHLEHVANENISENSFTQHAEAIRSFAAIFNENNAKATFEAKPEFVNGCRRWGDNVLLELYNQGHGIGVHADVGGNINGLTHETFVQEIKDMKTNMELLLGHEVRHVSGICSSMDWVNPAIEAGYLFNSGIVGYCALSLPEELRPDEYKTCSTPTECHGEIPVNLKDRVHPWRTSSGSNWLEDDPNGKLVILPAGDLLSALVQEKSKGFDEKDIEEYIKLLDEALTYSNEGKITLLYVAWSINTEIHDEEMLQQWLDAIQPYVDSGKVKWKTLPEMYDAYIS